MNYESFRLISGETDLIGRSEGVLRRRSHFILSSLTVCQYGNIHKINLFVYFTAVIIIKVGGESTKAAVVFLA